MDSICFQVMCLHFVVGYGKHILLAADGPRPYKELAAQILSSAHTLLTSVMCPYKGKWHDNLCLLEKEFCSENQFKKSLTQELKWSCEDVISSCMNHKTWCSWKELCSYIQSASQGFVPHSKLYPQATNSQPQGGLTAGDWRDVAWSQDHRPWKLILKGRKCGKADKANIEKQTTPHQVVDLLG